MMIRVNCYPLVTVLPGGYKFIRIDTLYSDQIQKKVFENTSNFYLHKFSIKKLKMAQIMLIE